MGRYITPEPVIIQSREGYNAKIDSMADVLIAIPQEHHEIHEGESHEVHITSANAAVAGLNVAFKTLAGTKRAHILFGWASDDEIKFELVEGATWDTNTGTLRDLFNHRRDDGASDVMLEDQTATPAFTATNKVLEDVTNIAGGTVFDLQYTYNAGLGAASNAESRSAGHEWVLKPDTTYICRLTQTGGNCKMTIDLHWYEHTDSN